MRIAVIAGAVLAFAVAPALAQVAGPTAKHNVPAKPAPVSTPEMRSAAELALSSDPVFDDGTYLRIKETLLSSSDIQVRGGWPTRRPTPSSRPARAAPMSRYCAAIS